MGGRDNEPQFTRTGYSPVLKPSIINFRSAAGVLEFMYLASIPASRNVCVRFLTWERLTQNTKVDFRSPGVARISGRARLFKRGNWRTRFVEPGLYNQRVHRLGVDNARQTGRVVVTSGKVDAQPLEIYIYLNAGKLHIA